MSSDTVIRVENLGKRYMISHQGGARGIGRYKRFSDVLLDTATAPFRLVAEKLKTKKLKSGNLISAFQHSSVSASSTEAFWALRDVSFEVKRGEVVGIIGRNGAGKSTLLKILSRITEPTTGQIEIDGRVASLLEVGTGFHPELTGRENIFLNGAILGMHRAEIKRNFDEIVAFAEVEKFLDTPVKRYSSGMYVRLAFAVAAHLEPEILIVDEVLAVGDAEFQKKCLGKMQDVASGGRTVLFVSHNMAAITNLCSRVIWLNQGKFEKAGEPNVVVGNYLEQAVTSGKGVFDRPSWATPLIQKVEILDKAGNPRCSFPMGQPITIALEYKTSLSKPLKRPVMGVIIHHATRGVVGGVNSRMTDFTPHADSVSVGRFLCDLDGIPLLPGRYSVEIWLGDGPVDLDTLPSACYFDLETADVYGTGKVPFADLGTIYLNPQWRFDSDYVEKIQE